MPKRFHTPDVEAPVVQLEASERRAREIVEGLRDAFISFDAQWRVTDCNARTEAILGRPRAQLLGRQIWGLIGVPPDSPLGKVARRVKETGEPEEGEFTLDLQGAERLLSVRGFPLGAGIAVLAGDITELRRAERRLAESEARFRELANGAPAPTWMSSADGSIEYINPAMLNTLGRSEAALAGGGWERFVHPDDLAAFRRALHRAQTGHSRFVHTTRVQREDGAWRMLQVTGVARFDSNGAFRGYVGMATDITDVVAAQKRQALLTNELNHRVRNTLATVQSIAHQTLKDRGVAKETVELLTDRLMALAAAHKVLTRENWEGAELSEMARLAVTPYDPQGRRVSIVGPAERLYPGAALALFMAINELATNAVRH